MRKLVFSAALILCGYSGFAQQVASKHQSSAPREVEKCSQHHRMQEMLTQDPERYATMFQEEVKKPKGSAESTEKLTGLIYTIPVVFHVLHNNGSENISDAQIQDQLNILNRDYRKLNSDANSVVTAFQGLPADVEVQFVFATVAPNGACFSGITRTVNAITSNGSSGQNQVNAVVAGNNVYQGVWPHNRYLNIYVCEDIGGAAGYTFNPNGNSTANATNMYYNGIFMLHDYTGSIGTSSVGTSRALTHEVGHWLNLAHVWGSTNNPGVDCSGTDNVQDTPATEGSTSCTLTANTCTSDNAYWGFNQIDQVENYMDYSYCSKMFTQGQVDRMRAALVSSVGGRSNIWTTANLNLVGGVPGGSLCAMDFTATDVALCSGDQTTFTMSAGGASITSYAWTFTGGTPSSSSAASPTITYSTPGTYQVSLTVVSGGNNYTKTKTAYISAAGGTLVSPPLTEGFTAATFAPTNWSITNTGAAGTWVRSTAAGATPTTGNSAMFDNFNIQTGDDELVLPNVGAASLGSMQMEFDVAYAPYDAANFDGLQVLASGDCGATFTTVYDKSNTVLATRTATTSIFTPTAAQWRHETIDLNAFAGNSRVILRMKNISGYGNRLFIDNVNVSGVANSSPPVASFTPSATAVCAGQTVTYTSTSTNSPTSYSWSFPGGTPSSSTSASQVVTYAAAGTYDVSLTATNANGPNTLNQTNYVTVNAIPAAPVVSAGGATTFCQGGSVTLNSSAGSGNTWSSGSSNASINATTSGSYSVTQTVAGCVSPASNSIAVTVNPNPTVSFGSVTSLCVYDDPITLTQGSPAGGTYSGTGVSGNQFDPATAGNGTTNVTYNFTNGNGCSGSAQTGIVVTGCLGVEEDAIDLVSVYPNPSSGIITIDAGTVSLQAIHVYDRMGKLVLVQTANFNAKQELNLTNVAGGLYTIQVITDQGAQHVPVVIEN